MNLRISVSTLEMREQDLLKKIKDLKKEIMLLKSITTKLLKEHPLPREADLTTKTAVNENTMFN